MLQQARRQMVGIFRALGSLLPRATQRPAGERIVLPWRDDYSRCYPSVGLTPSRALALLHAADSGRPQMQFELFHEMLMKWPRLAAVEATRRLALTGLDWEIAPAVQQAGASGADGRGRSRGGAADHGMRAADRNMRAAGRIARAPDRNVRAAEYCRATLDRLESFRDVLDHLAGAIGLGLAVAELVWEEGRLADIVPVPYTRLMTDPQEPWRLRVRTEDAPSLGVGLDEQPHKWLVHRPRSLPGRQFDGGLLRASVLLYLAQNLSFKDWLIFSQIAGMPVRVAQFEPGTPEADKQRLLQMLEVLGTDAVAVISKGVELKLLEAAGGNKPYQPLQDYCNTEVTILWLGQHLTTDLQTGGSRAAAEVHDRVREDLLVDDIADEGRTIRRDVLGPLVRARFGDVPTPHFRRSLVQAADTEKLARVLTTAVNELGLSVSREWVHRALGIPEAQPGDELLARGGRT